MKKPLHKSQKVGKKAVEKPHYPVTFSSSSGFLLHFFQHQYSKPVFGLTKSGLVYSLRSRWNNHRGLIIVLASTSFLSGGFGIESTAAVAHGEATRDNNLSGFVAFML